jgi:hypothetical protein
MQIREESKIQNCIWESPRLTNESKTFEVTNNMGEMPLRQESKGWHDGNAI